MKPFQISMATTRPKKRYTTPKADEEWVSLVNNSDIDDDDDDDDDDKKRRPTPSPSPSRRGGGGIVSNRGRMTLPSGEEWVSLLGVRGRPTPSPSPQRRRSRSRQRRGRGRTRGSGGQNKARRKQPPWTFRKLMRYLTLTAISFMVTIFLKKRPSKTTTAILHWEKYDLMLQPVVKAKERCYVRIKPEYRIVLCCLFVCLFVGLSDIFLT